MDSPAPEWLLKLCKELGMAGTWVYEVKDENGSTEIDIVAKAINQRFEAALGVARIYHLPDCDYFRNKDKCDCGQKEIQETETAQRQAWYNQPGQEENDA